MRNLAFSNAVKDALLCCKALRCVVCLRNRAKRHALRPSKIVIFRVFNDLVFIDLFFCADATNQLLAMMGIIDDATVYHVVISVSATIAAIM